MGGIGPMLAEMGWRVSPHRFGYRFYSGPNVGCCVVLSFMILVRLKALLDSLDRRFELTSDTRRALAEECIGRVCHKKLAHREFPVHTCTFPELLDNRLLKGAVRHAVERQLRALETQKEHGAFVHRLIEFGQQLLRRFRPFPCMFRLR